MAKKSIHPPRTRQRRACPPKSEGRKRILYIITKSVWSGATKYVYDLASSLRGDGSLSLRGATAGNDEAIPQNTTGLPRSVASGNLARNDYFFEVSVAAGGQGKFAQKIKQTNIPYYQIKNFQRSVNPFKDFFAFFEILKLLFRLKPDIIHVNSSKAGGLVGLAAFIYKILHELRTTNYELRTIFTAHGWALSEDRPSWQLSLIKFFSKLTALFYDKIICVSEYDCQTAIKHKITPANKLTTIHNGIDAKDISFLSREQAQKKLIGKTSPLVIGTIAEWTKNKGLLYLLEAVIKIKDCTLGTVPKKQSFKDCILGTVPVILIGSGENPDKEKIQGFIKKHRLENVYLHPWIDKAASYLKAFDIFVLPSVKEGLPYTILEAMIAEIPIIATKVGGVPEMLNRDSPSNAGTVPVGEAPGLLIQPKNSQQLAEKILYLINNPVQARAMAQKAQEKAVKEFSLDKMLQETKKLYY